MIDPRQKQVYRLLLPGILQLFTNGIFKKEEFFTAPFLRGLRLRY